jgi:hypothetical protein
LGGWAAGVAALIALSIVAWTITPDVMLDPTGFYCMAIALGGASYLAVNARRHVTPDSGWLLTIAILSVIVLLDRLGALGTIWFVDGNDDALSQGLMYSGEVEAGLVALAAITFGTLAGRAVRALPATAIE